MTLDTYVWSGPVIATRDQALFAIFNNGQTDPRRKYYVNRINIRALTPTTSTPGEYNVDRITAMSGGGSVPVSAADSANQSDWDDNVQIAVRPDVTSGSEVFRAHHIGIYSNQGLTLRGPGNRLDTGTFWNEGGGANGTQTIRCDDGEGFAVVAEDTANMPPNGAWYASMTLRYNDNTFFTNFLFSPAPPGQASIALMNNAGASGTYLELVDLTLMYLGNPTITTVTVDAPIVRYIRVSGINGGEEITPIEFDTSNAVPPTLLMRRNRVFDPLEIELMSERHGLGQSELLYPEQNIETYRRIGMFRRVVTQVAPYLSPGLAHGPASEFNPKEPQLGISYKGKIDDVSGIVIKPQQGLAAVVNNPTPYCAYWLDVEVTHEPPPEDAGDTFIMNLCE